MSLPIRPHPQARADLIGIWSHLAQDSETAADRTVHRFEQTFAVLEAHPLTGRMRPEVAEGLRSFPVGNTIGFYPALPHTVVVIRILSGYQELDAPDFPPKRELRRCPRPCRADGWPIPC